MSTARMIEYLEWNEPFFTDEQPYCNTIRRILPEDAIAYHRRTHPQYEYTDKEALEEFIVVNWAWFKEYPE